MGSEESKALLERLERIEKKIDEASNQPKAVKLEEAARLLSCSARHISRAAKKGRIRLVFPLGLRRVPMSEIFRLTSILGDHPAPTISPQMRDAREEAAEIRRRGKKHR